MKVEKLIQSWQSHVPKDAGWADLEKVLVHLGYEVRRTGNNHYMATKGEDVLTINAHAFGKSGKVHPQAIREVLKRIS